MAKKSKKEKKEKRSRRGKVRREERRDEPEFPYPGSDRVRDNLVRALVILCCIAFGLMIYSIHYFRYVDRTAKREAEEKAAKAASSKPAVGTIWFTQPDGTIVSGDSVSGAPQLPSSTPQLPSASEPQLPSASEPQLPSAAAEAPAEGEPPAETQEGGETAEGSVTPTKPPQPADTKPYV